MTVATLFTDSMLRTKIQERLPKLFYLAELESSRAGKVGMEVGSAREKILIALLIHAFGRENIDFDIPITQAEVDVHIEGRPLSIKTITRSSLGGVKIIWTVDAEQAANFVTTYTPGCDILLAQINWGNLGGMFFFPVFVQREVFSQIGRQSYLVPPKAGTNPRGIEISSHALQMMARHPQSFRLPIKWQREKVQYNPYERWLKLWEKD